MTLRRRVTHRRALRARSSALQRREKRREAWVPNCGEITVSFLHSTESMQWEHRAGVSAGAGLPGARLIGSEISFSQCLEACERDIACTAVDYVHKHSEAVRAAPPTSEERRRRVKTCPSAKPRKRTCYAIDGQNWEPCVPTQTVNIIARKIEGAQLPPRGAKNVLLVIFDDLRVVDGPFRQQAVPVASMFAASSTTFLSAHAQSALCAPSRASFLSGRRPDVTRVFWTDTHLREWPPAQGWITLPQHFQRNGYYTAAAGKLYHHLPDPASLDPMSWTEPECIAEYPYFGQGHCPEKPEYLYHVHNTSSACPVEADRHPGYAFTDRQVLHKAQHFLETAAPSARAGTRPFWIGVGFFKPHKPFVFPAELLRRMPAVADVQLPENGEPPRGVAPMANIAELCATKGSNFRATCARDTIRTYHAAAAFTDGLLGELLLDVERLQLKSSTLVAVMSDHGFALGEHVSWAKWTNWEVATRTVLMFRAPWMPNSTGQSLSHPVELVDLYPTVAELAGVPIPSTTEGYEEISGRSLAPLLRNPSNSSGTAAFSQIPRCWPAVAAHNSTTYHSMGQCDKVPSADYAFMGYSVRVASLRLTEWVPIRWDAASHRHIPQWDQSVDLELYDHQGDDGGKRWTMRFENENVASDRPADVEILRQRLRDHFRSCQEAALRTSGQPV